MDLWDLCCYSVSVLYVIELSDLHYSVLNPQKRKRSNSAATNRSTANGIETVEKSTFSLSSKIKNRSNRHKKELSLLRSQLIRKDEFGHYILSDWEKKFNIFFLMWFVLMMKSTMGL